MRLPRAGASHSHTSRRPARAGCCCRPALRGALQGCLALLEREGDGGAAAPLARGDAVAMLRLCTQQVFVRSLAQPDRDAALRVLVAGMERWGQALLDENVDLLEYVIASGAGRGAAWRRCPPARTCWGLWPSHTHAHTPTYVSQWTAKRTRAACCCAFRRYVCCWIFTRRSPRRRWPGGG